MSKNSEFLHIVAKADVLSMQIQDFLRGRALAARLARAGAR